PEHHELEVAIVFDTYPPEATALEEPHRGGIAHEHVGVEGADLLAPQELSHRRGPDAAAPEPLPEPVAEKALVVLPPRDDVAGDLPIDRGVLGATGGVAEHLRPPVRQEALPIAGRELCPPHGLLLTLLLEEHFEVRVVDIAQLHIGHVGE